MSIAGVEVFLLVHHLPETRGPSCAWYSSRESVLVKITDSDGVAGWGETCLRPGVVGSIENPMLTQLATEPLGVEAGWIEIPHGPGLGSEVDEEFVERMAVGGSEQPSGARR